MKLVTLFLFFWIGLEHAYGSTDLLMLKKGAELDFSQEFKKKKPLKLDNPFVIQLFSSWKALGALKPETNLWMELVFYGENLKALQTLSSLKEAKVQRLKKAAELYLLYRLGYHQSFLARWIELSSKGFFLKTELGLALDQVIGSKMTSLLKSSGFHLTTDLKEKLQKIESEASIINYSLQGLKAVSTGKQAIQWIGKIPENDSLRLQLAHTALLDYAKKGMLGASGKLIKNVIEPWMEKSQDVDEIASYYLTLGRLLYQAGAWDQSEHFYYLIPESSRYFMQARTEALWIHLHRRHFSKIKGELATLELDAFKDRFYPEIYLASAMANVMLCQFLDARRAIHRFAHVNRKWAKRIERELAGSKQRIINDDFIVANLKKALNSLEREKLALRESNIPFDQNFFVLTEKNIHKTLARQVKLQWSNRKKILEEALYKMRFVRVELLSRMRIWAEGMKNQLADRDALHTYASGRAQGNQMEFPSDGHFWGDELFNMSAHVRNLCLRGNFHEK